MVEVNGVDYELVYSAKRVERIESILGKSLMATMIETNGAFSLADLRTIFVNGLKCEEDGKYIPRNLGEETFEALLTEHDYPWILNMVVDALARDCPFFFPES